MGSAPFWGSANLPEKVSQDMGYCSNSIENAPACYRDPRWPDPEFPRKIPKKYPPGLKFWTPGIYPQNTPKIPKKYPKIQKMSVLVFFRYFRGIFFGFQNFGPGGIFSVFFVEIPGRAISGLCSRSGRSQQ